MYDANVERTFTEKLRTLLGKGGIKAPPVSRELIADFILARQNEFYQYPNGAAIDVALAVEKLAYDTARTVHGVQVSNRLALLAGLYQLGMRNEGEGL